MREEKYHRFFRSLLLIAAAASLSGCDWVLFNSKGQIGVEQGNLIITATLLMLIVVVPVIVMTFLFAWRYRASNKQATYTPEWAHSHKIEAVVWGVPLVIIIVLAVITWKTTHSLDPYRPIEAEKPGMTIEVVSMDWKWLFIYPEQGIATVNELYIPEHTPVTFHVTSQSVMNTFFIPQLGGMIYAMGGMRTHLNLIANETGQFFGLSGNYSGHGFTGMRFMTHAVTDQEFDQWVGQVKQSQNTLDFESYKMLAKPSENNPVEYFNAQPGLFRQILGQYIDYKKSNHAGEATHASSGAEE
ncbi:ubiquinol oxidase subunit II [Pseudomonas matsuisoli]|uniref:Ubiquinol oxidase subunit 2 n=1 Tax=Pseudomonas matsuisoli TaxID=1515666 RepID=A0A917PK75_9PSED|nr:ubiquinol oxidase subunit II [Pseudomonas matsuisoli]GGJ82604.1 ubiquinol oxidase subunit 2 [Pseudomonas matsuisoli]